MSTQIFPLISPEEVMARMNLPGVVIIDARGGPDAIERYLTGHVEGAIMLNLESDLSEIGSDASVGGRHPLPAPENFAALLGKKGISRDSHIFVYDDKAGANAAARFWWMMRAIGHEKIQVIDGGLSALKEAGVPLVQGQPIRVPAPLSTYPFSGWGLPLADINTVDMLRADGTALIIDVRENFRYRGESEPIDLIAGHIPGAINLPYLDNLKASGRFRSPEELAAQFRTVLGKRKADKMVVHCGSGVTACHTLLAMETAGLTTPRLYIGSWSEWSRNRKPVATGDNP